MVGLKETLSRFERGTVLGLFAVVGTIAGSFTSVATVRLASYLGMTFPPVADWCLGCVFGVAAGDIVNYLRGQKPAAGKRVGIAKGLIAVGTGLIALRFGEGTYPAFVLSTAVGAAVSDFVGL